VRSLFSVVCSCFFYFGELTLPLILPWACLSEGFLLAFSLCMLAGILPAVTAAFREPLKFIQAGRATM
jgi:ABC-type antimicrobial peptide transport system permease subunit